MRPYIADDHDAMEMVRHHHEHVQIDLATDLHRPQPFVPDHFPIAINPHFAIGNSTKQAFALVRDDGDEVCSLLGIIVPTHAN